MQGGNPSCQVSLQRGWATLLGSLSHPLIYKFFIDVDYIKDRANQGDRSPREKKKKWQVTKDSPDIIKHLENHGYKVGFKKT
jgi:hypothetical protein